MIALLFTVFAAALVFSDPQLVKLALRGKRAATAALVGRLLPVVQARVSVFLSRRPTRRIGGLDQDDLVQDIWLALMKDDGHALRGWDPARGMRLEGYVGMLAQRQLWHQVEAHQAAKRGSGVAGVSLELVPERVDAEDPEQVVAAQETLDGLRAHLEEQLAARGRLVLAALYDDGLDAAEAAAFIGVSKQVVYNWQHKIRTLSRAWLSQSG